MEVGKYSFIIKNLIKKKYMIGIYARLQNSRVLLRVSLDLNLKTNEL